MTFSNNVDRNPLLIVQFSHVARAKISLSHLQQKENSIIGHIFMSSVCYLVLKIDKPRMMKVGRKSLEVSSSKGANAP